MTNARSAALAAALIVLLTDQSAFAAGDAARGEQIFKAQCTACHSLKPGENKTGPSLAAIFGRKAGTTDFPRYKGLVGATFSWTDEALDGYLTDPREFVQKNTANQTSAMTYALKDAAKRQDVIAYLKTVK